MILSDDDDSIYRPMPPPPPLFSFHHVLLFSPIQQELLPAWPPPPFLHFLGESLSIVFNYQEHYPVVNTACFPLPYCAYFSAGNTKQKGTHQLLILADVNKRFLPVPISFNSFADSYLFFSPFCIFHNTVCRKWSYIEKYGTYVVVCHCAVACYHHTSTHNEQ